MLKLKKQNYLLDLKTVENDMGKTKFSKIKNLKSSTRLNVKYWPVSVKIVRFIYTEEDETVY